MILLKIIDSKGFLIDFYHVKKIKQAQKLVDESILINCKFYVHIKSKIK